MLFLLTAVALSSAPLASGSARIEPARAVVKGTGTWTVIYTTGPAGIHRGGGLQINFSGFPTRVFETPQVEDARGANYLTASCSRE